MYYKGLLNVLISAAILLIASLSLTGQKSMKYGIGLGMIQSKINQTIPEGAYPINFNTNVDAKLGLSFFIRAERDLSDKFSMTLSPGFDFLASRLFDREINYSAVAIKAPLELHYFPVKNIFIGTGISYNYLLNLTVKTEMESTDVTKRTNTRHLVNLIPSIGYVFNDFLELSLSYNHGLNNLVETELTDINGFELGTYSEKFNYFQLGFVFRK